ncbi:MAG TPA: winged helix-turn-helix domain-containing protein [Thermoanaerobaculia bacterium]|jgi:DNA-binding transcriptional ArsR family regulator
MGPEIRRHANRFAALGHEVRLEIVRRLLVSHPTGMVAGEIQEELNIPASILSHHLDALHQEGLVEQRREVGHQQNIFFLWRPCLQDSKDDMILELAVAADCEAIVTHNHRDFAGTERFSVKVYVPREFLRILEESR